MWEKETVNVAGCAQRSSLVTGRAWVCLCCAKCRDSNSDIWHPCFLRPCTPCCGKLQNYFFIISLAGGPSLKKTLHDFQKSVRKYFKLFSLDTARRIVKNLLGRIWDVFSLPSRMSCSQATPDADLENVLELDAPRLVFPGIIAQATGFISFSLQDLRPPLEAPEPLVPEPGTLGGSCCAVHPQCPGVCWMYSVPWGSLLKGVGASEMLSPHELCGLLALRICSCLLSASRKSHARAAVFPAVFFSL